MCGDDDLCHYCGIASGKKVCFQPQKGLFSFNGFDADEREALSGGGTVKWDESGSLSVHEKEFIYRPVTIR